MMVAAFRVCVVAQFVAAGHAASDSKEAKALVPDAVCGYVLLQTKMLVKDIQEVEETQSQTTTVAYEEGSISSADYDRRSRHGTEQQVQEACSNDDDCKGYWQRVSGEYYISKSGSRTWAEGVPNGSVTSVKVRKATSPGPAPVPQPIPQEDRCKFSEEKGNLYIPTTLEQYDTMDKAKIACNANPDCGGVTFYLGNYEARTGPGLRRSSAGASSWVCEPTSQDDTPVPQPSPQPVPRPIPQDSGCKFSEEKQNVYIPATIEDYTSLQEAKDACNSNEKCGGITLYKGNFETRVGGAGPCLLSSGAGASSWVCERSFEPRPQARPGRGPVVPDSKTCWSRTRDNTTVAPEEWEYFLAFQESRKKGHSSPCKDDWDDCGKGLGDMHSGNSKSNVKGRNSWNPNPVKVVFDCKMWVAAYRHAEDQAIQGYFNHFGENPRTSERDRSERVGAKSRGEHQAGRGSSALGALTGLQSSPGHSNSMFQPKYKGMAVAHGKPGQRNIWTVLYNFGGNMIEDSESCIPEGYTATGERK